MPAMLWSQNLSMGWLMACVGVLCPGAICYRSVVSRALAGNNEHETSWLQFKNGGSASRVRAGPAFRRKFLAFLFWLAIGYVWRHMSSLISTIEVYSRTYGSRPPSVSTNRCCPATARTTRPPKLHVHVPPPSQAKQQEHLGKKKPGGRELHVHVCATITTGNFMLRVTYLLSLRLRMFVPHTSLLLLNA